MFRNGTIYLSIASFVYILIIAIRLLVNRKSKNNIVKGSTDKLFSWTVICTLVSIIFEVLILLLQKLNISFYKVFMTLYLCAIVVWASLLLSYILIVLYQEKGAKVSKFLVIPCVIFMVAIAFLRVDYTFLDGEISYSRGPAVTMVYLYSALAMGTVFINILCNIKKIKDKRFIPVFIFLSLMVLTPIIQTIYPEMLLNNFIFGITVAVMYHIIENPETKIAELEKKSKEDALKQSSAKSDSLDNMSHEIKNSLNAIMGLSEDIGIYSSSLPSEVIEDIEDIKYACSELLDLAGCIIDFNKLENGQLEIVNSNYNLRVEFESLIKIEKIKAKEKSLSLDVDIANNIPEVLFGDHLRVKQIINNILNNSIKHTGVGSISLNITWDMLRSNLVVKITDTGKSISDLEKENLFTYNGEGITLDSGIGLVIAKDLLTLMGGSVKVDNQMGNGNTFTIVIPQKVGNKKEYEDIKNIGDFELPSNINFAGKRMLIVEDNVLNVKVIKKALHQYNFDIDICSNGQDAVNKVKMGNKYDVILMDEIMPVMNGSEALQIMKHLPNFTTPVIALTAENLANSKEKYESMGFNNYLSKPFTKNSIVKKICEVIKDN